MHSAEPAAASLVPVTESSRQDHHHVPPDPGPVAGLGADSGPRRSWAILALILTAQILVVLDISVVNTALPTIGVSLRLDGADLQWLVTAYRTIAAAGLALAATGAALLSTASGSAHFVPNLLPGRLVLGLGVGMVFVSVSVTAMTGIPSQHAGMASGFLMTGHEIGAALGVAALSTVAVTAGSLTSPAGVAAGFSRGFIAATVVALLLGIIAFVRMPSTPATNGASMHMH